MTWPRRVCVAIVTAVLSLGGGIGPGEAAGPWRGQVVDAETGEPLEAVAVLAVWDKLSPGFMHPAREFYDVDEVVTDAEGRFVIPARRVLTANPFVSLDGPNLHMFKPGYGRWRERGLAPELSRYDVQRLMQQDGVVFELPARKTREERLDALPSRPSKVPDSRMPRFMDALDAERVFLGLTPIRQKPSGGRP